ncbi:hypothetical protein ID866_8830 [Astraeus odoratus]|nr:hypothetical protein ID866_8830 [Astraeus odoratus]
MQVPELALASLSVLAGGPGDCSQGGRAEEDRKKLGGPKPLHLSSLCMPSLPWMELLDNSSSMETTLVLSKNGGMGATRIRQSIPSSNALELSFTPFPSTSASPPDLLIPFFPVPHALNTFIIDALSPPSLQNSQPINWINIPLPPPKSSTGPSPGQGNKTTSEPSRNETTRPSHNTSRAPSRTEAHPWFNAQIPANQEPPSASTPLPYLLNLTPTPSPLQPHCLAKD